MTLPNAIENSFASLGSSEGQKLLPFDFAPSLDDVICQKGRQAYCHPGNTNFRLILSLNVERYGAAPSKTSKSAIVNEIVDFFREKKSLNGGGGFVRFDKGSGHWYEIRDAMAREKVGFSVREELRKRNPIYMDEKRRKRRNSKRRRAAARKRSRMNTIAAAIKEADDRSAMETIAAAITESDEMIRCSQWHTGKSSVPPAHSSSNSLISLVDLGCSRSDSVAIEGGLLEPHKLLAGMNVFAGTVDEVESLWDDHDAVPKTTLTMGESREWFSEDEIKQTQVASEIDFSVFPNEPNQPPATPHQPYKLL